jgi:hypothetical protein
MLKVDLCATACLQAVVFRHILLHCLQASSGTRFFVRSSYFVTYPLFPISNSLYQCLTPSTLIVKP